MRDYSVLAFVVGIGLWFDFLLTLPELCASQVILSCNCLTRSENIPKLSRFADIVGADTLSAP